MPRVLSGVSLTGSHALTDIAAVKIMVGNVEFCEEFCATSIDTDHLETKDVMPCWGYIPAGQPIEVEVIRAAATDPLCLGLDIGVAPPGQAWIGGHLIKKHVPATTCALDYDFAEGENWQKANHYRRIMFFGLTGSAAEMDTEVELDIGTSFFGNFHNTTLGEDVAPLMFKDIKEINCHVPPSELISVKCIDAATTNEVNLFMSIIGQPIRTGAAGGLRGRGYNRSRGRGRRRY